MAERFSLADLTNAPDDQWVTPAMLAEALGRSRTTLKHWRRTGAGPRFTAKPRTRLVAYRVGDVRAWLQADPRTTTSKPAPAFNLGGAA